MVYSEADAVVVVLVLLLLLLIAFLRALWTALGADSSRSCRMRFTVKDYPFIAIYFLFKKYIYTEVVY